MARNVRYGAALFVAALCISLIGPALGADVTAEEWQRFASAAYLMETTNASATLQPGESPQWWHFRPPTPKDHVSDASLHDDIVVAADAAAMKMPFFYRPSGRQDGFAFSVSSNGFMSLAPYGFCPFFCYEYTTDPRFNARVQWPMIALWSADLNPITAGSGKITDATDEAGCRTVTYDGVPEFNPADRARNLTAQVEMCRNGTITLRYVTVPAPPNSRQQALPFIGLVLATGLTIEAPRPALVSENSSDLTVTAVRYQLRRGMPNGGYADDSAAGVGVADAQPVEPAESVAVSADGGQFIDPKAQGRGAVALASTEGPVVPDPQCSRMDCSACLRVGCVWCDGGIAFKQPVMESAVGSGNCMSEFEAPVLCPSMASRFKSPSRTTLLCQEETSQGHYKSLGLRYRHVWWRASDAQCETQPPASFVHTRMTIWRNVTCLTGSTGYVQCLNGEVYRVLDSKQFNASARFTSVTDEKLGVVFKGYYNKAAIPIVLQVDLFGTGKVVIRFCATATDDSLSNATAPAAIPPFVVQVSKTGQQTYTLNSTDTMIATRLGLTLVPIPGCPVCVHGTCGANDTVCSCPPAYTGVSCDVCQVGYFRLGGTTLCARCPDCQNGGTCSSTGTCDCKENFAGPRCERDCGRPAVCRQCVHGQCDCGKCVCDSGWEATACDQAVSDAATAVWRVIPYIILGAAGGAVIGVCVFGGLVAIARVYVKWRDDAEAAANPAAPGASAPTAMPQAQALLVPQQQILAPTLPDSWNLPVAARPANDRMREEQQRLRQMTTNPLNLPAVRAALQPAGTLPVPSGRSSALSSSKGGPGRGRRSPGAASTPRSKKEAKERSDRIPSPVPDSATSAVVDDDDDPDYDML